MTVEQTIAVKNLTDAISTLSYAGRDNSALRQEMDEVIKRMLQQINKDMN